jgi:hypothetical protein
MADCATYAGGASMKSSASQIGLLIGLSKYLNPSGRITRTGMMKNDGRWWHWDTANI